ncbi:MAG: hypothetical protein QM817_20405 [Archangium sp.]
MIKLQRAGTLTVSAASGCVVHEGLLHVVADDDAALHSYTLDGTLRRVLPLFPDVMPADEKARKKVKPDLEALAVLPDGALLAIGSGSTDRRRRAALVRADAVQVIDCTALFERLSREFEQLNIEGLAVHRGQLVLGQRGNGAKRENALVRLKLDSLLRPESIESIERLELPELEGVPLSLTDLALSGDGSLHFSAAAEDTDDPYLDGECTGSVVGALDGTRVLWTRPVSEVVKVEGLTHHSGDQWFLVCDADDPHVKAPLFTARF